MRAFIAALVLLLCLADAAAAAPRATHSGRQSGVQTLARYDRPVRRPHFSRRSAYDPPASYDGGRNRSSYRGPSAHQPYPSSYRRRR